MGPPAELRTPRLTLARMGPEYADGLIASIRASLAELQPFMAWAVDHDPRATRSFTEMAERRWDDQTGWTFAVLQEREPVGACSLDRYEALLESCEVGYWMRTDLCSRGLMTEAASAVVEFGFEQLRLHRLELHAAPDNHGSIRIAEKLGFRREGVLRDGSRGIGGFHDVYVFGLLAHDPRARFH